MCLEGLDRSPVFRWCRAPPLVLPVLLDLVHLVRQVALLRPQQGGRAAQQHGDGVVVPAHGLRLLGGDDEHLRRVAALEQQRGNGQSIGQLWNGTLTMSGSTATVRNLSWNASLGAGASTTFGFTANGSATTPTIACGSP